LVVIRGGALAAVSAGVNAASMEAAEPAEWLAEVAAALALGAVVAVGQVWAGGGGGAGALDVELGVPIGTKGWGGLGSVDWPEVGPGVASLSRWYLACARAPPSAVQYCREENGVGRCRGRQLWRRRGAIPGLCAGVGVDSPVAGRGAPSCCEVQTFSLRGLGGRQGALF